MRKFKKLISFEWNRGNYNKECEESFFDSKRKIYRDKLHSKNEQRYVLLGKTKKDRLLFISFTKRGNKIRVISARPLDKKGQRLYYGK